MLRVLIRGGGDVASGIAVRLKRAGCQIVMLETSEPRAVRRTVSYATAVHEGSCTVEDVPGRLLDDVAIAAPGEVSVLVDPNGATVEAWQPDVLVDARMLKREPADTNIKQAPLVVGVGPGFTAGVNCHAVVETNRGHDLGRVYYEGGAAPDTGIPGDVLGYSLERIVRAHRTGVLTSRLEIGDRVDAGQEIAQVDGEPVVAQIAGVLRGLIRPGTRVQEGEKIADVDPRGVRDYCFSVSDRSNAIAGGVLEAVMKFNHGRVQ